MNAPSIVIPLGARVRFARQIIREEYADPPRTRRGHTWEKVPDTPGEGVFVGYRQKQNGSWQDDSEPESYGRNDVWCESGRVKVALVVLDPWAEPITVDPDGVEIVTMGRDAIADAAIAYVNVCEQYSDGTIDLVQCDRDRAAAWDAVTTAVRAVDA